ncbi:hypothetical protein CVT24_012797 [Panaeolus cyanescens]|uniref:Cytochrome P450 n=1 Tax=Panaeolus cyanescens TaxID=181874 RepID=A0A409W2M9_9AGAR|nr:hypothetical protein CVT24_012797 [Panaeolus cyanescens]
MNDHIYQKPPERRYALSRIIGHGLLVVEGEKHKHQRRIMNPAFGSAQIRALTEIFVDKSIELRDAWLEEISKEGGYKGRIEVMSWLSRMTLDVIGLAGFNYKFNALSSEPKNNELNKAFSVIFRAGTSRGIIPIIRGLFPPLRWLPAKGDSETLKARKTMDRIGEELLKDSKSSLDASEKNATNNRNRDLLSLLLRANTNTDLPANQKMSDNEVLDQVPTFLVAGHETTSTATTWALYALARSPEVQTKLRRELVAVMADSPTMDQLNSLMYLDQVVRETLRLYAPVPGSLRTAVKDDVIPLSQPIKDVDGKVLLENIPIKKGDAVFIPILVLNRSKEIWGDDSLDFCPERWISIPQEASQIPGVWSNMLTFLGGPRACIGFRFSLVEMKALLFTLIRAFEFELAVPVSDITSKTSLALLAASAAFTTFGLYKLTRFVYYEWTSPLRGLPGPPSPSLLWGNMKQIFEAENSVLHEQWVAEYGTTITYKAFFGMHRLYTTDTKAINHILMNNYIYQKPGAARYQLSQILGSGVLVVEEDKHKQQRRIMNPAFGAAQIREMTDIFVEKAIELRDLWLKESAKEGGKGRIDVLSWLSRMTLDVIGLAGFNYRFNALTTDPEKNELNRAFSTIFRAGTALNVIPIIRGMFPALRWLPAERDRESKTARSTMDRIGKELLSESKSSIKDSAEKDAWANGKRSRDLLSLLLRANMSTDLPPSQRMTDEDVLAQVPTFLVAGHETTSTATTWALYALTQAPEVQIKLRQELLGVPTDTPTMDELNALPYLDCVVRETLRIHAPVPSTMRVSVKDDILPLAQPVKDKDGNILAENIRIRKGQTVFIPILVLNRAKEIWGDDALEFKPERWQNTPEAAAQIPGVWGNMLTFLGGPRSCIGYRFSLVEMKALLFTLVRAFEFELAVPPSEIAKRTTVVQRPVLRSDPQAGNQMPLFITPYAA